MLFCLYWIPVIIGILSFLFCRFFLSKYDWSKHEEIPYKMKLWAFILYLLLVFTPYLNWTCLLIIFIVYIEKGYRIKESIKDFCMNNKFINLLNKEI